MKEELALVKKIQMVHHQEIFIVMVFQLAQIGLKEDRDSMYGYVFQYTNDNVDIGSNGTNLNTDLTYSFALYDTS